MYQSHEYRDIPWIPCGSQTVFAGFVPTWRPETWNLDKNPQRPLKKDTPWKCNMDTHNSHIWKEIQFKNHHFWYLYCMLNFGGGTPWKCNGGYRYQKWWAARNMLHLLNPPIRIFCRARIYNRLQELMRAEWPAPRPVVLFERLVNLYQFPTWRMGPYITG